MNATPAPQLLVVGALSTLTLTRHPIGERVASEALGGKGNAEDTISSGLEGAWTSNPIKWDSEYLDNLYNYEWALKKGPGGG